jgi:hypothetical protein
LVSKDDWRALKARADALPGATRSALAEHWANAARMEHASVAAFSRFSLQLLAVGAPPALLEETHRAALDEIKHAELCFSLASVYGQKSVGPGPLPVTEQALCAWDLTSVAVGAVEEGCVGETIAALEAQAAAELAGEDAVRHVLRRIHEDEARHSELAWRFVRWAALIGGAPVKQALALAFERTMALHGSGAPLEGIFEARLEAHGVLSAQTKRTLRARIMNEVIRPPLAQLLA